MKTRKIVAGLGEVLWDLYPDRKRLGGAPANAAVHARRLGLDAVVISSVGNDTLGDAILATLAKQGIDIKFIQRNQSLPTGTVKVRLDDKGRPEFTCSSHTAFDAMVWKDELGSLAASVDAVIFGTLAQREETSRKTIQKFLGEVKQALKIFDVNFRAPGPLVSHIVETTLPLTDVLKLNGDEALHMRRMFRQEERSIPKFLDGLIRSHGLKLAALTLGEKGCLLSDGEHRTLSIGTKIRPKDTTGSGDAFCAGLAVCMLEGKTLEATAEFANLLGAFTAFRKGAAPLYTRGDLSRFRLGHKARMTLDFDQ